MGLSSSKPATPVPSVLAPTPRPASSGWASVGMSIAGGIILLYVGWTFYNYIQNMNGQPGLTLFSASSGDKTPAPIDGKTKTIIPAGEIPVGQGSDYGLQFWMYISNWDYRFGQEKEVIKRTAPNNAQSFGPRIYLSPTDNTLNIQMSIYPNDAKAASASPGANTTGDSFTCSVENVPLQTWFSVSTTVFQRNVDIYINGRLVKSCVLPGIPKPALGDIIIADGGGFAGSFCNLNGYSTMLSPDDAMSFYTKGTSCAPPAEAGLVQVNKDSVLITLFGYTFRFSTVSKDGKELSSYTL